MVNTRFGSALSRLGLALAALTIASPALAQDEDFNIWTAQFLIVDIGEDFYLRGEAQERFTDDADRLGQLLLRSLAAYRLTDSINIGVGYAYIFTDPLGPAETNEHRFYQELNLRLIDQGGVTLDSRNRLEQRTFEQGTGTAWRFRPFVQLRIPLSDANRIVAYSEPFIGLNETAQQRSGMVLWRNFAGVSVPLARGVEMVPGYLNQQVYRDGPNRTDHIANVNLFMNF